MMVRDCHQTPFCSIYFVSKYCDIGSICHVSYCPLVDFRCFCMKMESFGMPCDHIVVLLVFLDFREVPKCLVLNRWTKKAKKSIIGRYVDSSTFWDSSPVSRHAHLHFLFTEMAEVAPRYEDDYNDVVNILVRQVMKLGKNMGTRVMQKIKTVRLCMIQ